MKRLTTHIEETEALEQLDEGLLRNLVRTGSVLANANAARRHGDKAANYLRGVANIIRKPMPQETEDQVEERLERIELALLEISKAMIAMRSQLGAATAVSTSAALLADRTSKQLKK